MTSEYGICAIAAAQRCSPDRSAPAAPSAPAPAAASSTAVARAASSSPASLSTRERVAARRARAPSARRPRARTGVGSARRAPLVQRGRRAARADPSTTSSVLTRPADVEVLLQPRQRHEHRAHLALLRPQRELAQLRGGRGPRARSAACVRPDRPCGRAAIRSEWPTAARPGPGSSLPARGADVAASAG